jgi:hypothetical protein
VFERIVQFCPRCIQVVRLADEAGHRVKPATAASNQAVSTVWPAFAMPRVLVRSSRQTRQNHSWVRPVFASQVRSTMVRHGRRMASRLASRYGLRVWPVTGSRERGGDALYGMEQGVDALGGVDRSPVLAERVVEPVDFSVPGVLIDELSCGLGQLGRGRVATRSRDLGQRLHRERQTVRALAWYAAAVEL